MPTHSRRSRLLRVTLLSAFIGGSLPLTAPAQFTALPKVALKVIAEGFTAPIALSEMTDGSGRFMIADQLGLIRVLEKDGRLVDEPLLDLRSKIDPARNQGMEERGILGLALHPQFKSNHKFYTVYSAPLRPSGPTGWSHTMRVSEFQIDPGNPLQAKAGSERVVLEIDEPLWNHNSGRIGIGPDGFLYLTVGDGGAPNDTGVGHADVGNGHTLTTLLGKMLRLDLDGSPYNIPKDNPYADGKSGRPEIYAYGLRNSWGFSWDRGGTHELFLADVGQDIWEEVNMIVNGGNYGWRVKEGSAFFNPDTPLQSPQTGPKAGADGKPFIDPILTYKNARAFPRDPQSRGSTVVGGYIYRGKAFPNLVGKYVFGDWAKNWISDGQIFVATRTAGSPSGWTMERAEIEGHPAGNIGAYLWAYGEDEAGELYLLATGANTAIEGKRGKLLKLVPPQ